ncbi:MAG: hypothetical protein [Caudoviricetes sp.]|nr:MAG: hypothetical protein [Caudoviricetes sp.]
METHLLITQDGFKVNEKDNVSWVINNKYAYELTLCEGHKKLINSTDGVYKVFKNKDNAIKYHDEYLLKNRQKIFNNNEEALSYHEAEVKRLKSLIEEENKPKVGDWVINEYGVIWRCKDLDSRHLLNKIKDQELINKLNELIK